MSASVLWRGCVEDVSLFKHGIEFACIVLLKDARCGENGYIGLMFEKYIQKGDTDMFRQMVEVFGSDALEKREGWGNPMTALSYACRCGQIGIVKICLEKGARVNCRDDRNETPLIKAVQGRKSNILRLLVDHNADLSMGNDQGSPLLHAAAYGHISIVNTLLEIGANILDTDSHGRNALHIASSEERGDIVLLLLSSGVSITCQDNRGYTPLHTAVSAGSFNVVSLMLDRKDAPLEICDKMGNTPLGITICNDNPDEFYHDTAQPIMRRMIEDAIVQRGAMLALAMSQHPRIGNQSHLSRLDEGVIKMIADQMRGANKPAMWR